MSCIGIIGAGSWGVALAQLCAANGHRTVLWARRSDAASQIVKQQRSDYLPTVQLDPSIEASANPEILGDADTLLSVVPVQATRKTLTALAPHFRTDAPLVLCSKGVESDTLALPTVIAAQTIPDQPLAVLSGPSFAIDVVCGLPTAVTIAASELSAAQALQEILGTKTFRLYASEDVIGAQIGGAIKNVLAIACGIVVARNLGESARAAIVARGFAEMVRLAEAMGARRDTLAGLSGLGDLVLTCGSDRSRNFAAGLRLGDPDVTPSAKGVSEGKHTAGSVAALAKRYEIEMPISETVSEIVSGGMSVDAGIADLLTRPVRTER